MNEAGEATDMPRIGHEAPMGGPEGQVYEFNADTGENKPIPTPEGWGEDRPLKSE